MFIAAVVFLGHAFLTRNALRIGGKIGGGKIGRHGRSEPVVPAPEGFSRAQLREIMIFTLPKDAAGYKNLNAYARRAPIE